MASGQATLKSSDGDWETVDHPKSAKPASSDGGEWETVPTPIANVSGAKSSDYYPDLSKYGPVVEGVSSAGNYMLSKTAKLGSHLPGTLGKQFGEMADAYQSPTSTAGKIGETGGKIIPWIAPGLRGASSIAGKVAEGAVDTGIRSAAASGGDAAETGVGAALGAVGGAVGGALEKVVGKWLNPEELYQSALKPSGTNQAKAAKNVATGLREGIPTTKNAPDIARQRIDVLNKQIDGIVNNKPKNIPATQWTGTVRRKLDALRDRWGKAAGTGSDYVKQIDAMERKFLLDSGNPRPVVKKITTHQPSTIVGPNGQPIMTPITKTVTVNPEDMSLKKLRMRVSPMSTPEAQGIKRSTYEATRTANQNAFEPGVHPVLKVRVQKELAGAMREDVAAKHPELRALNARDGTLIELEKELQRFVKRESNKQRSPYFIFPATGALLGSAAGHLGGEATAGGFLGAGGALAGHMMRTALEDPAVKSKLAIAIKKGSIMAKAGKAAVSKGPGLAAKGGAAAMSGMPGPATTQENSDWVATNPQ